MSKISNKQVLEDVVESIVITCTVIPGIVLFITHSIPTALCVGGICLVGLTGGYAACWFMGLSEEEQRRRENVNEVTYVYDYKIKKVI